MNVARCRFNHFENHVKFSFYSTKYAAESFKLFIYLNNLKKKKKHLGLFLLHYTFKLLFK